jgi:hypothetical protein
MRWAPQAGHVPRGFVGAVGELSEVELVMVVAEPGNPQPGEVYDNSLSPRQLIESVCEFVYGCFERGQDLFHRNIREVLDLCWPGLPFESQMRRVWITESVLCSAKSEGAHVAGAIANECVARYLARQVRFFRTATVAAFGGKAQRRLDHPGVVKAHSVAPPGCNRSEARASWHAVAQRLAARRLTSGCS